MFCVVPTNTPGVDASGSGGDAGGSGDASAVAASCSV